jgi:hypothetical protein
LKEAIVYIRGLNTHADSDWCGMRQFMEKLAAFVHANLVDLDFDDGDGINGLEQRLAGCELVHCVGHSHGAAALYDWLKRTNRKVGVAVLLDMAPQWQPLAWMGSAWVAPANCDQVLVFYQRNDAPLSGIRLLGANVQEFDVTGWGLHHSSMCADQRVQDRIALAILWENAARIGPVLGGG